MKLNSKQKEQIKDILYKEYVINNLSINKIKKLHPEIKLDIRYFLSQNLIERIKPTKEELYQYYVVENHTLKECKLKFNCDIPYLLKLYNISKREIKFFSKEELYQYYVVENHSCKECEEHFKVKNIGHFCTKYNIVKGNKKTAEKIKSSWTNKSEEELATYREYQKNRWGSYTEKKLNQICSKMKNSWDHKEKQEIKKIVEKRKSTRYIKNEGFYQSWMKDYSPLFKKCIKNLDYFKQFMEQNPNLNREDLSKLFRCSFNVIQNFIQSNHLQKYVPWIETKIHISKKEQEIADFIKNLNILDLQQTNRNKLDNSLELDIYIPSKNIGIEFNGTYWHSTLMCSDKNYHFNKSKLAQEKGIRLIHIWEYEWDNKIQKEKLKILLKIALGSVGNKIYARKCEIKQITNKEAKPFNELNHLQGHRNAQVTYGLFYNNELVQLMSFSKTKYNRNLKTDGSWEIIRGCPASNNIVIGGVSKLFKHFIKDYNPNSIFSYCDFNKFNGKGYEVIGMKFIGYTGPDMKYWLNKGKIVNRNPTKYKENKNNCIAKLYGAGSKKYEWRKKDNV